MSVYTTLQLCQLIIFVVHVKWILELNKVSKTAAIMLRTVWTAQHFKWNCHDEMIHFLEVKSDHRSKFSNLSNWKEEAWKNQGLNGIRTRDLRDTGALPYQLSYEAPHWEQGQFIEFIFSRAVKWCEVYMK